MKKVDFTAPGKLVALIMVILGCFGVIITGIAVNGVTAETIAAMSPFTALLSGTTLYLIGNGTGAAKGFVSVPPFQPAPNRQLEILTKIVEEDPELKADPAVIARAKAILQKQQDENG